jgi:hypothetical protein
MIMSQSYQTIDVVRCIAPHLFDNSPHRRRASCRRATNVAPLTDTMMRELESMSPWARQHYAECAQQKARFNKFLRNAEAEDPLCESRWVPSALGTVHRGCNEISGSQGEWVRSGEIEEIENAGETNRPDECYGRQLRA